MSNYSTKTQQFLNHNNEGDHTGNLDSSLAELAIEQFGGEEAFLAVWEDVCDSIVGVSGWTETAEMVAFYENNREKILEFHELVADEEGYDTLSAAIAEWGYLDGKYTVNDVKRGLYDNDSKQHKLVAEACAMSIGQETARYYQMFDENYEESDDCEQGDEGDYDDDE